MNKQKFEKAIKLKVLDFLDPLEGGFNDLVNKMVNEYEIENGESLGNAVNQQLYRDHAYIVAVKELKSNLDYLIRDN